MGVLARPFRLSRKGFKRPIRRGTPTRPSPIEGEGL